MVRTLPSVALCRSGASSAGSGRLAVRYGGHPVAVLPSRRRHGPADGHGLRLASGRDWVGQHPRSAQAVALTFSKKKKDD